MRKASYIVRKHCFHIIFLLVILLSGCNNNDNNLPATYKVKPSDFIDNLIISGFVQPLKSSTVVSPRRFDGVVQSIIDDGTYVKKGEVVCVLEDNHLLENYNDLETRLENSEAELSKGKADMNMQYALLEAQVKTNDAETQIANLDSLQLKYIPPTQRKIKELELERAKIERQKLQEEFKSLKVIQQAKMRKLQIQIKQNQAQLTSVKKRIDELTLRAPSDGLALRATSDITGEKLKVGDQVWSLRPLVAIPQNNKVKVKINAAESDFKRIEVNDSVHYTFDAMPNNSGWGRIIKKSPVGRPIKRDSKVKVFEIEASVDSVLATPDPGFTCNCNIVLQYVPDTIVVPQIAVFEQDSMKVVYVVRKHGYEMRQVETGLSSPNDVIISKGLKRNEVVTLSKPDSRLVKRKKFFKVK